MAVGDELRKLQDEAQEVYTTVHSMVLAFQEERQREVWPEGPPLSLAPFISAINWLNASGFAGLMAFAVLAGGVLFAVFVFFIENFIGPTGLAVMETVLKTRGQATATLNKLTLASMEDLFGVKFEGIEMPEEASAAASLKRAQLIGDGIFNLLEHEFAPDGVLNAAQGEKAAKIFTGFSANFAVSSAFITLLGEIMSFGAFESFRELGVELADNLGLGRMSRRGLSELVSKTVSDPYEWFLNRKYRPTRLSSAQAIRAFNRGLLSDQELHKELAEAGYSEQRISALIALDQRQLSPSDYWRLLKWGVFSRGEVVDFLRQQGFTQADAELALIEAELGEAESQVRAHAQDLHELALKGIITKADFNELVGELPLGAAEIRWRRTVLGNLLEVPRKRVTEADMESAFLNGLITLSEYMDFLGRVQGYPREDRELLAFLLLVRAQEKSERDRRKKELEEKRKREQEQGSPPAS